MKNVVKWALVPAFVLAASAALANPALASAVETPGAGNSSVLTFSSSGAFGGEGAVLTIAFDRSMSSAELTQAKSEITTKAGVAPRSTVALSANAVAGPSGAYLYCNNAYTFSDSDGSYSFQHACGGTTGNWGYKQNPGLCSIVTGTVHESGMSWTRNGVNQGTAIGHTEACGYQFHGTYNPDHDYDFVTYNDDLTFRVNIGGATGSADLNIKGSFTSAGCSSGKACGM